MYKRLLICMTIVLTLGMAWGQQIIIIGGGPQANHEVKPVSEAIAIDSMQRKVGVVVGLQAGGPGLGGGPVTVLIEVEGSIFTLNVWKHGLAPTGSVLVFSTPNCSGTPYILASSAGNPDTLVNFSVIGLPGKSLYVPVTGVDSQLITMASYVMPALDAPFCAPVGPPSPGVTPPPATVFPAVRIADLNQFFTAPFSIRTTP